MVKLKYYNTVYVTYSDILYPIFISSDQEYEKILLFNYSHVFYISYA